MATYRTIKVANPSGFRIPRQVSGIIKSFSPRATKTVRHRYKCVGGMKVPVRKKKNRNPYRSKDVPRFTRAATSARKKRQWLHVYESARKRGYPEGSAIAQASGAVKRNRRRKRNQDVITDALAGQIATKLAPKITSMFTSKRRTSKRRKRGHRNPHLALIGANPRRKKRTTRKRSTSMARRRRSKRRRNSLRGRPRDSKGRLLKVRNTRKRRRRVNASPRRRRRNRARTKTVIRYRYRNRTRRVNVARRRRRKSTRRRSRRRNMAALAVNPRRRRRRSTRTRVTRRRRRRNAGARRYSRRRRNAGLGGLIGRVNLMQVAEVAGGVFLGDKITTYLGNQVNSMIGITDPTTGGLVKTGLGIVTAGFVWRFRPALGLGIAVGAANALLNQYVFGPLWGYATPYLPGGMAGLGEYVPRSWKMDNWLAEGGAGVAGMGQNKLLTKGL